MAPADQLEGVSWLRIMRLIAAFSSIVFLLASCGFETRVLQVKSSLTPGSVAASKLTAGSLEPSQPAAPSLPAATAQMKLPLADTPQATSRATPTLSWSELPPVSEALLLPGEVKSGTDFVLDDFGPGRSVKVYPRAFHLEGRCHLDCAEAYWETVQRGVTIRLFRLADETSAETGLIALYRELAPGSFEYSMDDVYDDLWDNLDRRNGWILKLPMSGFVGARRYGSIIVNVADDPYHGVEEFPIEAHFVEVLTRLQVDKLISLGYPP